MKLKNVAQSASSNVVGNGGEAALKTKPRRKRSRMDLTARRNAMGYIFILPFLIGLI